MKLILLGLVPLVLPVLLSACAGSSSDGHSLPEVAPAEFDAATAILKTRPSADELIRMLDRFAPVILETDLTRLPPSERAALDLILEAGRYMDEAFLRQVDEGNPALRDAVAATGDETLIDYFRIMRGPWDRLDEDRPYLGAAPKPEGAAFYPKEMTRANFESHLVAYPGDREAFESNFTVIRREGTKLAAVPYHAYYRDLMEPAAAKLREAAGVTRDATLETFLRGRADALLDDDYYDSDLAWLDLAGDIEVVIGPYEVYEDGLMGYKAAYSTFLCVVDHPESEKLKAIEEGLDDLEGNLPIPDEHKNFNRAASAPMKVVDLVYSAGDARAGVMTFAFNLPNDERVREARGSKQVLLKNVMEAKFEKVARPIADLALAESERARVSFDVFFNHTLLHEVSHSLGPGRIRKDGKDTTVNRELKELYSALEECKADALGIYNVAYLIERGLLPESMAESLWPTYLGEMFRSVRFGINEAHGQGMAMQLAYGLEHGAFGVNGEGRFFVNRDRVAGVVEDLVREVLMIQALGDYGEARRFVERYAVLSDAAKAVLGRLEHIPVDIRPSYPLEK